MENALLVRLGQVGLRVPGVLWQRITAREAQRSGRGIGWMTPGHHRVRDFAVTEIVRSGKALSPAQIASGTGLRIDLVRVLLGELERGQLTGRELAAVIDSVCAHCSRPMQIEVASSLRYQVTTRGAAPLISVPLVNFKRLKDPSIIHAF